MTKHESHRGESHDKPLHLVETQSHYGDHDAVIEYLAKRQSEGWELVSVVGTTFYFKAAK
jgi:hypothetical protein